MGRNGQTRGRLLNDEQLVRYSRQILLDELGVEGQAKLLQSRVLLLGAGGLGSPAAIYLAAAGVGTLGIVDADRVDLSNLHRQVLHFDHDLGRLKTQSARRHLEDINPDVRVIEHRERLEAENAREIVSAYDVVINGCDNFATRYLINDVCVLLGKPLVDASILKWEGQTTVFLPGRGCYRCLFPEPPPPGEVPSCAEGGIIGALAGHMGTRQAIEAIKVLLGVGEPLAGRLVLFDALTGETRELTYRRNPKCPICGDHPTITELIDYEQFCGLPSHPQGAAGAQAAGSPQAHNEVAAAVGRAARAGTRVPPQIAPGGVPELDPEQARERLESDKDALLLDCREPWEYELSRVPGSLLIPMGDISKRLNELNPERPTIVICRSGNRSAHVTRFLLQQHFREVYNLAGGIIAWRNHRLPAEGRSHGSGAGGVTADNRRETP